MIFVVVSQGHFCVAATISSKITWHICENHEIEPENQEDNWSNKIWESQIGRFEVYLVSCNLKIQSRSLQIFVYEK